MLNLQTCCILQLRDVQQLNRKYYGIDNNDDLSVASATKSEEQEVDSVAKSTTSNSNGGELNDSDDSDDLNTETLTNQATQRQSGHTINAPTRLIKEIDSSMVEEIMAMGAGIGGGFDHTSKLRPMKYEESMATPKAKQWGESVDMEHDQMVNHIVFKAVRREDVPKFAKILTSTWAMKQKTDGTLRARVTVRGYEQRPREHYDKTGTSSPSGE